MKPSPRNEQDFEPGFSTVEHFHAVFQLIEKSNEYPIDLCVLFVD